MSLGCDTEELRKVHEELAIELLCKKHITWFILLMQNLKHQWLITFVDKLVLNLSFDEVILAPVSSFSRAWVAAEMVSLGSGRGSAYLAHYCLFLVQYMKT
jgi:hypothetical protein